LPDPIELATLDLSFISLCLVLPAVQALLAPEGRIIALVKPQFEVGKGKVGKGGVVRDPALHGEVLERFVACASELGLKFLGLTPSPILGPAGNREFLALVAPSGEPLDAAAAIAAAIAL
jgi:23S rRNA (cytidine1920-2'-O)/16S rRNA (cytidine1409-2'-O)-methyltransferase